MKRLLVLVFAVVVAWLGWLPPAADAAPLAPAAIAAHRYDHSQGDASPSGATTERSPPAPVHVASPYNPEVLQSLGESARPDAPTLPSTYDYDVIAIVHTAGATGVLGVRTGGANDGLVVVQRSSAAANGGLRIIGGGFSESERYAAETLAGQGRNVVLREADSAAGRTSDLLVDDIPYDVYTPTTGSLDRLVSSIASKGSQVRGGGVVLDLSKSSLTPEQVGNILPRVQGITSQISDIIVLGGP